MSFLPSWTFISVFTLQQMLAVSRIVRNISPHIALMSLTRVGIHIVWRLGLENSSDVKYVNLFGYADGMALNSCYTGAQRLCMHQWINVVFFSFLVTLQPLVDRGIFTGGTRTHLDTPHSV